MPSERPAVFASRPLQVVTALIVINTVAWIVQVSTGQAAHPAVVWGSVAVIIGHALVLTRRARVDPGATAEARYYWRTVEVGASLFVGVALLRMMHEMGGGDWLIPVAVVVHLVGGVILTWPLVRLPFTGRGPRVELWIDIGTLLAAAGILIWHFAASRLFVDGITPERVAAAAVIMGAGLNSVYLMAKGVLAGVDSFARRGLYWIGGSAVIGGLGSAISFLLPMQLSIDPLVLVVPFAAYTAAVGARVQVVDTAAGARPRRAPRSYSLMPYVAVAAVDALVIYIDVFGVHNTLVDLVAVALTGLVVVRQLIAFRQNGALLARIGKQENRFRLLVQNSTDVVTITAPSGVLAYISPAVRRVLGVEPGSMVGTNIAHRVHPDDRALVADRVAYVASAPEATAMYQMRLLHADGSYRWLEVISANLMHEPSVAGIVSNSRDITETREVQDRLSFEASHDALTGLANRTLFGERVTAAVTHVGPETPISIVLVDLDDFKIVNDTLGHATGDALLVHVAERMLASVRPTDTVARLGGDEFALLFEGVGGETVDTVLTRIGAALFEPALIDGQPMTVRASFGVVDGRGGDDPGNLLRQADIAMYEAKERGEGGYERYRPGMEARGAERSRLATRLRTAIAENELVLHYQPVVSLPDGRITGAEALVRWQHPVDGLLGPGAFIDTAEQTGLIVPLGRWALRTATAAATAWPGELSIAVNVSPRQLREAGFPADVAAALRDSGLPAHRLTVEITESTAVGGGATQDNLQALRDLGVRLSLDDFGTGASTLSLLATCPVDQIKLDRSFVPGSFGAGDGSAAIATAVIQMAAAFGVEAVAEGIETAEQADRLYALGYRRAQGFHFARPMPPADFTDRIRVTGAVR